MPWVFLQPFIKELPGLQAADALYWSTIGTVASGNMKKGPRDRIIRDWQRVAGRDQVQRPRGPQDVAAKFAAMGIAAEIIPRKVKQDDTGQ